MKKYTVAICLIAAFDFLVAPFVIPPKYFVYCYFGTVGLCILLFTIGVIALVFKGGRS